MTKRDCPQLPLLVHRKTTTLASTTFSEPRRGRPYSIPQRPATTLSRDIVYSRLLHMPSGFPSFWVCPSRQRNSPLPLCRRSSSLSC